MSGICHEYVQIGVKAACIPPAPEADRVPPTPAAERDLGRINARYGVGYGDTPTDYFRIGANHSIISSDPASLKKNRQGSVMQRGQTLWQSGALTDQ